MGTNMIDPKRMERIWKACPELRPEQMEWWKDDACWFANGQPDGITPMIAAALIRDKCVWWLGEESLYFVPVGHSPRASKPGGWCFQLMGSDMLKEHLWCESGTDLGPDPTEACLLAVERVLGLEPWDVTIYPSCIGKPPERSCPPRER